MLQKYREYKKAGSSFAGDRAEVISWCEEIRKQYRDLKDGKEVELLTEEIIDELNEVGFYWVLKDGAWNEKYALLCSYKEKFGDCRVPHNYEDNGVNLGNWVRTQRQQYRKREQGEHSTITLERITKLEAIGFEWEVPREVGSYNAVSQAKWESKFDHLQQYKQQYGDCRVPVQFETEDGTKLGTWVQRQRTEYRKRAKGQSSSMTEERIAKLEEIGFEWELPRGRPKQK